MKKTIYKKGLASLLILALLMMYIPSASFASTDLYRYVSNHQNGTSVNMTSTNGVVPTIFNVHQTVGGTKTFLAYCIDLQTVIKTGIDYEVAFLENVGYIINPARVRNVVYNSYPNKSIESLNSIPGKTWDTLTQSEAITATQAAIWHLTHNSENLSNYPTGNVRNFYTYLIGLNGLPMPAVATINLIGPTVALAGSDVSIEFYYKTEGLNSNSTPVSLSLDASEASGFAVTSSIGVDSYAGYTKVIMTKPTTEFNASSDFTFKLSVEGTQTLEDVYVFKPVDGKDKSQTLVSKGFMNTNSINREIDIDLTGYLSSLTINKSYEYNNGTPYVGNEASFELKFGQNVIASGTTSNLILTINNLFPGAYTLVETSTGNYTSSLEIQGEDLVLIPFNTDVTKNVVNTLDPEVPTEAPTTAPTQAPTEAPTAAPTQAPTEAPTAAPTEAPTEAPTSPPIDIEELEVEPEPIPLAPPIIPEEPEATEDEVIEEPIEEITLDEEIPLGSALPQTGQIPAEIFFGIGSVLSLLGISIKKKK